MLDRSTLPAATVPAVRWEPGTDAWVVRSHQAVEQALVDEHLVVGARPADAAPSRDAGAAPTAAEFMGSWFSLRGPDAHRAIRQALHGPYAERRVAQWEGALTALATARAGALAAAGDLVTEYFGPYAVAGAAGLLGVPDAQLPQVTKVVDGLGAFMHRPRFQPRAVEAIDRCARYLRALVDLVCDADEPTAGALALRRIAAAAGADRWDAVSTLAQLLTAGFEPTVSGAVATCRALWQDPNLRAAVASGGSTMADVVEEALRLDPPFPRIHRRADTECTCLGVRIPAGSRVVLDIRTANRDPAVDADPARFRPGRDRRLSLSFGRGPHHCVGASLARLQISVAVGVLFDRHPTLRPAPEASSPERATEHIGPGHLVRVRSLPFQCDPIAHTTLPGGAHGR